MRPWRGSRAPLPRLPFNPCQLPKRRDAFLRKTPSPAWITRPRPQSPTDKVLVCLLSFRTIEAGDTLTYNARHTVWLEPGNNWRTQFMPNY